MNVLFLDQFNEGGGAQQCLLDLIGAMREHNLHALLPGSGALSSKLREHGVAVHELPRMEYASGRKTPRDVLQFAVDTPRAAARIRRIADQHRIDVVYVNGPRLLPAAALAHRNFLFHAHSHLGKWYAAELAVWCLQSGNARVIASSRFVARPFPPGRVRVIYNGTPELRFRDPVRPPGRPWRVGIVGRIAPEKGHIDFIRAARALADRGVEAEFYVYGAPLFSAKSYLERVRGLSSGLPVHFEGWSNDLAAVFDRLDLLAVPSSPIDATPRVILEAFSAGVPVVAYPSGGIPELIENGATGILTHDLASSIEGLLSAPARMARIAGMARLRWEERFTVQRYAREVLDFLATMQPGNTGRRQSRATTRP